MYALVCAPDTPPIVGFLSYRSTHREQAMRLKASVDSASRSYTDTSLALWFQARSVPRPL
jgi:hypothetical protein